MAEPAPLSRPGPLLLRALRVIITLGLAAFLIFLVNPRRVGELLGSADVRLLAAALAVALFDRFVMIAKWYPLLTVQLSGVSLVAAGRAYLASGVAHYILPASVGADVLRAVALGRGHRAVAEIGASIVAERVLGLVGSALMAAVAVVVAARDGVSLRIIIPWAGLAVGFGIAVLAVPMSGWARRLIERLTSALRGARWLGYVDRLYTAYATYRRHATRLALVAVATVLEQLLPVVWFWLTARALDIGVGFGPMFVAVTLTLFASRLPISLGGLGVGEGALVYLLGIYGVPASDALAIALAARIPEILVNAGPGLFLWRDLVRVRRAAPKTN